jgi:hypothetical protein
MVESEMTGSEVW